MKCACCCVPRSCPTIKLKACLASLAMGNLNAKEHRVTTLANKDWRQSNCCAHSTSVIGAPPTPCPKGICDHENVQALTAISSRCKLALKQLRLQALQNSSYSEELLATSLAQGLPIRKRR